MTKFDYCRQNIPSLEMVTAIIIGFYYLQKVIPAVIIDLFRVVNFCQKRNFKFYLFSDISVLEAPPGIVNLIDRGLVEKEILNFKIGDNIFVRNYQEFSDSISKITIDDTRILVYYSGHGTSKGLKMPDDNIIPSLTFRNLIVSILKNTSEIVWLMDCCNPDGLLLPYKLNSESFNLITGTRINLIKHKILLITSADVNEKSQASGAGSLFTKNFFSYLEKTNCSSSIELSSNSNNLNSTISRSCLINLINEINSNIRKKGKNIQNVNVYSSYFQLPMLPLWITHSETLTCHFDLETLSFVFD